MLPLGYFIEYITSSKRLFQGLFYTLFILLIGLNLFQTWQSDKGIIHGSRMTQAYYLSTFGKTSITEKDKSKLLINRSFDGSEKLTSEDEFRSRILDKKGFEDQANDNVTTLHAYSGEASYLLNSNQPFFPVIEVPYAEITKQDYAWIRASIMIYPVSETNTKGSSFVITFEHNGYYYKHKTINLEDQEFNLNKWNKITFDYLTPEVRNGQDKLKVYLEHQNSEPLLIDDLKVEVYEPK